MYNPKTTDASDLQDLLLVLGDVAQSHGLTHFKSAQFEATFAPQKVQPQIIMATSGVPNQPIGETHGMPTEDELLFASSPYPMTEDEVAARPPP